MQEYILLTVDCAVFNSKGESSLLSSCCINTCQILIDLFICEIHTICIVRYLTLVTHFRVICLYRGETEPWNWRDF